MCPVCKTHVNTHLGTRVFTPLRREEGYSHEVLRPLQVVFSFPGWDAARKTHRDREREFQ